MAIERLEGPSHNNLGIAAAAVAVSAWGLAGVIAKDIDMGGVALGAYRFLIYGLVVASVMSIRRTPLTARALRASRPGSPSMRPSTVCSKTASRTKRGAS